MTAKPAAEEVVWWGGLRWVDAAQMQLRRFEEAFSEEVQALADALHRQQLSSDTEASRAWRESYAADAPYDPRRPLRVPSWSLHMQVANEFDLLVVAIRNVLRAQDRVPAEQRPSMGGQNVLELFRNVAEHWNEVDGRSVRALAANHPDLEPGAIAYTNKEIWIGGLAGVPLSRITAWLLRVRSALLACLEGAGVEIPDDLGASRVAGDDDLVWPAERLHFHWSLPRVEEQDWPRETMPEEVAAAFAARFANLRARDHAD